jgi:hypothetical protein
MDLSKLRDIIEKKEIKPTIINEDSNFVVVTYWWGRNVNNQNTSRPCIAFFENIFSQLQKLCVKTLGTSNADLTVQKIYMRLEQIMQKLDLFNTKLIENSAKSYTEMIFEQLDLPPKEADRYNKAVVIIEKRKATNKTPQDFELKEKENVEKLLLMVMLESIRLLKANFLSIYDTNLKITEMKSRFLSDENPLTPEEKTSILREQVTLKNKLASEKAAIKKILNTKQTYETEGMQEFNNMSIYEILYKELRFLTPMTYNDMISKWERECAKFGCNHMAVEYDEFAKPGGYQMAINAKPLFIKKALEACAISAGKPRAVLYIDGDMFIRKYPTIFDMTDVDFMARGWWIDPRSSWKMDESITYDPYTFETSGGTMFFSQSLESKKLISKWIEVSESKFQIGKADDRILSLVFNTYKFLCSMKIIQLPIEYLWLTLDYDERMMEMVYDYNKFNMQETIFIEHSECLTSEDTASGSGAASDRTPMFYCYLEENLEPVSEQFHEYMMFPSLDVVSSFKSYLDYMSGIQYISDGNEISIKKGLISMENPEGNEQPLYITKYENKWGDIKYPHDDSLTYNKVADINIKRVEKMNTSNLGLVPIADNTIEINDFTNLMKDKEPTKYNHAKIISLIIKLLQEGKNVIYNPKTMTGYDPEYYQLLLEKSQSLYQSMEFIFVPDFTCGTAVSISSSYFYKAKIKTNQAIMFRPSEILIKFLMMFLSIDDLSAYINNGSYEFMSRVRIGYLIKKTQKPSRPCASVEGNSASCGQKVCLGDVCIPDNSAVPMVSEGSGPDMDTVVTGPIAETRLGGGDGGVDNPTQDADLYMEGLDILYEGEGTVTFSEGTGAVSEGIVSGGKKKRRGTMRMRTLKRRTIKKGKGTKKGKKTRKIKKAKKSRRTRKM